MKKYIQFLFVAMLTVFAASTFAQNNAKVKPKMPKQTIEQKATRNTDSLKIRLNLTDVQYSNVLLINIDFFKARDAAMKAQKTDTVAANHAVYKEQIKKAYEARKKAINTLLTPEQKLAWKSWKKSHAPKNGKTGAKAAKPARLEDDDIDLNEPQ
ncbi:MAG: hypothetical protein U0U67_15615 [Chitinophagales bacterium]